MSDAQEEELLNRITAIQAAAEILDGTDELSPGDRLAFLTAIRTEAARLHALLSQGTSLFPEMSVGLNVRPSSLCVSVPYPCDNQPADQETLYGRYEQRRVED